MSRYFDENGNLKKTLLSDDAEKAAQSFISMNDRGRVDVRNSVSSAQLRRFYGDFKGLEKKLEFKTRTEKDKDIAFQSILPLVKMVKSKVAYASNPSNPKIPRDFKSWMTQHVDCIETVHDFEAFMLHFEAVVGFCYGLGISNS